MKTKLILLMLLSLMVSCQKKKVEMVADSKTSELLESTSWTVESLTISGKPQPNYHGITFSFLKNGTIECLDVSNLHIGGRWYVDTLDATDDQAGMDFSVTIGFDRNSSVALLSRNWQILHESDMHIVLGDCRDGAIDSLVLRR